MSRLLTMATIVQRASRRCDREQDLSISATEWKALAHEVYGELCQEINDSGCRYFETEATITATGAANYALDAAVLYVLGVEFVIDAAGNRRALQPLLAQERARWLGETGEAFRYTLDGANLVLYPKPSSGSYRVRYVPQPTDISALADGSNVDLVCPAGERFIIWGMASLAQHKGEVNQQRAMAEYERARQDLRYWAANRDLLNPPNRTHVVDVDDEIDPDFWSSPP